MVIQKGDLVVFDDKHRVFCGDSLDEKSYRFMPSKAKITLTSPPYNMAREGKIEVIAKKYNDRKADNKDFIEYTNLLSKSIQNAMDNCDYVFYNIQHVAGNKLDLIEVLYNFRFNLVDTIIWAKDTTLPSINANVLNSDFEYIYIFNKEQKPNRAINVGVSFNGNVSNLIRLPRNHSNEYSDKHSALMPLVLCNHIIKNFTLENDLVLDVFSGLGTTMMSCMQNNRTYYGIELEPSYVEGTIERYLDYAQEPNIYILRDGVKIELKDFREQLKKERNLFEVC
jgi:DNA modification methylase